MAGATVDDLYYEVAKPNTLAEKVMIAARDAIYRTYSGLYGASAQDSILDVGVSDVVTNGDNMLERKHPHPGAITAAGLGEGAAFRAAFPEVAYVQVQPDAPLPFADRQFDVAVSNAVLEHVGSRPAQERFVAELLRVGRNVFLTVPNRYFFVEHHTLLPLLHWSDATFPLACRLTGKTKWAQPETLILMTRRRLAEIATRLVGPEGWTVGHTGIAAGPCSSNLYLNIRRRA